MIITSLEFELVPASSNPNSSLLRLTCLLESSCVSSRFRLRFAGADRDEPPPEASSLSDSMIMGSLGVSLAFGVEVWEESVDDVRDPDLDRIVSNRRWGSSMGTVNSREDDPIGPVATLGGGGDLRGGETPGRAYSSVQCFAVLSCCFLFLTYSVAIDGTSGSCGLGSVSNEESDSMTLNIERAGDHWLLRMSMQTAPRSEMFMWYIRVMKRILGAENG